MLTASSTSLPTGSLAARAIQLAKEPTPFMRKAAGASAAGVLALGLLALPFASSGSSDPSFAKSGSAPEPVSAAAPAAAELPVATFPTTSGSTYGLSSGTTTSGSTAGRQAFTAPQATTPTTTPAEVEPEPEQTAPAATKPDEPAGPLAPVTNLLTPLLTPLLPGGTETPTSIPASVGVNLGGHDLGIDAVLGTEPAVGVEADDTVVGTTDPETPTSPGVVVQVGPLTVPVPLG